MGTLIKRSKRYVLVAILLFLLFCSWGCSSSGSSDSSISVSSTTNTVWVSTITHTARILRDEWLDSGPGVHLFAAKNEWESFQILVRSNETIHRLTVEPEDLIGPEGFTLEAADANLFRQHLMEITVGTYRNKAFRPGWYPDALIPFRHPLSGEKLRGGNLQAVPFTLPPDETHGFWVDIFVPPDAPPGEYHGCYTVRFPGGRCRIPVTLNVWDFGLPDTPSLKTAFGSLPDTLRRYYKQRAEQGKEPEPTDWDRVDEQCAELLRRNRINMSPVNPIYPEEQENGTYSLSREKLDALRVFIDRFTINAVQIISPAWFIKNPIDQYEDLCEWLHAWDEALLYLNRPEVSFYIYLKDEPNNFESYEFVRIWGGAVKACNTSVKVLVTEQTWPQNEEWGTLEGTVDIWVPLFPLFRPEKAVERQQGGEEIWIYTALTQLDPTPWWHTDFPLTHYRVPAWTAWKYDVRGLLYWGGMAFWDQVEDPWLDPATLTHSNGNVYNGEGSLLYPARAVGYDGVVPSMRLKALRDAIEDYEYMTLLAQMGLREEAVSIVDSLTTSMFEWNPDPLSYEEARKALAGLIIENT